MHFYSFFRAYREVKKLELEFTALIKELASASNTKGNKNSRIEMSGKVKNLTDKKDFRPCIPVPSPNKSFRKPLCVQTYYPL